MLMVKRETGPNGARQNQFVQREISVPEGWIRIPSALEAAARAALPYLQLTLENGVVVAVAEDTAAREADAPNREATERAAEEARKEAEAIPGKVKETETRVKNLEDTTATSEEVQAIWDQMAEAYSKGVQEA